MGDVTQVKGIELAKEKMLQAESSLENYFRGPAHTIEFGRQLLDVANAARREYLSQLAVLWPEI